MQNGATALILAAQMGHTDLVTQLLERGADVSAASEVRTLHRTHNSKLTTQLYWNHWRRCRQLRIGGIQAQFSTIYVCA